MLFIMKPRTPVTSVVGVLALRNGKCPKEGPFTRRTFYANRVNYVQSKYRRSPVNMSEKSYTSKASFLDEDSFQPSNRGMKKNISLVENDYYEGCTVLKTTKVLPMAFANGIAAVCAQPCVVNVQ
ncbi:MAG: hypothetical protein K6T88_18155 [Bacillus sp. (in: Bacteria)]|nr:hypothetical protein [Bacillus sp. (in: firmicutes)]